MPFRNIFRVFNLTGRKKRRSFQFQDQLNIEIFSFTLKFEFKAGTNFAERLLVSSVKFTFIGVNLFVG